MSVPCPTNSPPKLLLSPPKFPKFNYFHVSCPQKASDFNESVKIALILLFPFLFQSPVFLESLIVLRIFLFVWLDHLAKFRSGNFLEFHWRYLQFLVINGAFSGGSFFLPPFIQLSDFFPRMLMCFIGIPVYDLVGLLFFYEVNQQLEGSMQKDFILIVPAFLQGLYF